MKNALRCPTITLRVMKYTVHRSVRIYNIRCKRVFIRRQGKDPGKAMTLQHQAIRRYECWLSHFLRQIPQITSDKIVNPLVDGTEVVLKQTVFFHVARKQRFTQLQKRKVIRVSEGGKSTGRQLEVHEFNEFAIVLGRAGCFRIKTDRLF